MRKRVSTQINTDEVITSAALSPPFGARVFDSNEPTPANDRASALTGPKISIGGWRTLPPQRFTGPRSTGTRSLSIPRTNAAAIAPTQLRYTLGNFTQDISGTEVRLEGRRNVLGWDNHFTYGVVADYTSTSRPRNRYQQTLATGATTNTVAGETYPNKNFPDTDTTNAGAYIQNIAQQGALRLIPAIRYDYYHISPNPDADFYRSNSAGYTIHEQTETAVSPKLGATYDLSENYRLFGQYARGFRAPPYDNANFAFRNATFGYEILPNGNLKPETSTGYEGGLRGRFNDGSTFQVSAYYNQYKDFIDTVVIGQPPATTLIQYQYQNVSNVTIYGVEGKGEWRFTPIWSLFGSFAYAYGVNNELNAPLNSVDPFTSVSGLRYRNQGWVAEGRIRYAATKNRVYTDPASNRSHICRSRAYRSRRADFHDVVPNFTVNLGIFNIFDTTYYEPQSVAGVASNNPNLELYRAAGRTVALNAIYRW